MAYYSTSGKNHSDKYPQKSLEQLLSESKVISIHCPLNEKTQDLITEKELNLLQNDAVLINVGRGGNY